jgi:flotillin
MQNLVQILIIVLPILIVLALVFYVFSLRRIVPTNLVHIVQRGSKTVSYGVGKTSNVYYEFPFWLPKIGVAVRSLPVSNFDITLEKYEAYDKDRVPFIVSVKAFFQISDTNKAAEKVNSFEELKSQLTDVVRGSIRSILAQYKLDSIMEDRSIFGQRFTDSVNGDLANWGVIAVKNLELMDVRDAEGSKVIENIMAKRISEIDAESRIEVAKNKKVAQQAELEALKEISLTKAETERESGEAQARSKQAIGIAQADSLKNSGIAEQESLSEIARAKKSTTEQEMEVLKISEIKTAEIQKEKEIIESEKQKRKAELRAEAEKITTVTQATAELEANQKEAEGVRVIGTAEADVIKSKGSAEAESKKLMELANVTAQTELAKEIGENQSYQNYLIKVREVEVSEVVGVAQAKSIAEALSKAELKLLVNAGDVQSGMGKFSDLFTSKGGSQVNGLIESLKQTAEGVGILSILDKFTGGNK